MSRLFAFRYNLNVCHVATQVADKMFQKARSNFCVNILHVVVRILRGMQYPIHSIFFKRSTISSFPGQITRFATYICLTDLFSDLEVPTSLKYTMIFHLYVPLEVEYLSHLTNYHLALQKTCRNQAPGTRPLSDVLLQNLVSVTTRYFIKNSEGAEGISRVRDDITYGLFDLFSARYGGEASTARFVIFEISFI